MPERILSVRGDDERTALESDKDANECDGEATDKTVSQRKKQNSILAKFNDLRKKQKSGNKEDEEHTAHYTLLDVFRNRRLTIYAISMAFLW